MVYAGDVFSRDTLHPADRRTAHEIHPPMAKPSPVAAGGVRRFRSAATRGGELTLTFTGPSRGIGSAGRGNQMAEVWLIKEATTMDTPWESLVAPRLRASQPVVRRAPSRRAASTWRPGPRRRGSTSSGWRWSTPASRSRRSRNIVLATRDLPAVPFARIPVAETWTAKRVLDAGVHGVVFPFISTPALAEQAPRRAATRRWGGADPARAWPAPPGPIRVPTPTRPIATSWSSRSSRRTSALMHIDEIAATPGVDVVFVGTGDLSFSLGLRGDQQHPRVQESAALVLAAARRHGKIGGRPAGSFEETQRYIEQGFCSSRRRPISRSSKPARSRIPRPPTASCRSRRQRTLY